MLGSVGSGWVGHDRLLQGRAWKDTGQDKARLGDLVWPGRPHIGLPGGPREPGQAQASAKDRSAPGIHTVNCANFGPCG